MNLLAVAEKKHKNSKNIFSNISCVLVAGQIPTKNFRTRQI
jgi:hypothetical protein